MLSFVENEEDKRKRLQKLLIASVVVKIRNSHIKTLLLEVMVYEYKSRINHIGLTVPDIEAATAFFKEGLNGKIAYDSQRKTDEPRGGEIVEHILGLEEGHPLFINV